MSSEIPIRVIVACNEDVYRDGLRLLLSIDTGIEVVGEARNGKTLLEQVKLLNPDIVITDLTIQAPDEPSVIGMVTRDFPSVKTIALYTFESEQQIVEAVEAGASSCIIKNAQKEEIIEAIRTVHDGHPYYCKSTSIRLVKMITNSNFNPYKIKETLIFSEKDKEIIRYICEEKTTKEIAEALFISTRTVEGIRSRLLEKMKVKTAAGIVIYAIRNSLYRID